LEEGIHWDIAGNWLLGDTPDDSDHVIFDISAFGTIMDLTGDFPEGRKVCSMTVTAGGSVRFGAAVTGNPNDKKGLHHEGDMKRPDGINDYEVILGPWDRVFVGAPGRAGDPPTPSGHGQTYGLKWTMQGSPGQAGFNRAVVIVSDTIGCGQWTAQLADITVGHRYGTLEEGVYPPDDEDALGIIDGSVCGVYPPGNNEWNLNGVLLRAKRALNLHDWQITEYLTESGNRPSDLELAEYFAPTDLLFSGWLESRLRVGFGGGDPDNPPAEAGLRVFGVMNVRGPLDDPQHPEWQTLPGPTVIAERFRADVDLVTGGAVLALSDGAQFLVEGWAEHGTIGLPVEALFQPRSSLRYGRRLGSDSPEIDPPNLRQPITRFQVTDRSDRPREPALRFLDVDQPEPKASYITTALPRNSGLNQEMELKLRVHLDVHGDLSKPSGIPRDPNDPAQGHIAWDTGSVDLVIERATYSNFPVQDCVDRGLTGNCEAQVEVITGESCNVWFIDEDMPEPRCVKYWRSLTVGARDSPAPSYVKLVDRHDNYPSGSDACDSSHIAEALYIRDNVIIHNPGPAAVDLNGLRLYYGGEFLGIDPSTGQPTPLSKPGVIPLCKTRYGDLNCDCRIDDLDAGLFPAVLPAPAAFPNLDWDGNCLIDPTDAAVFWSRVNHPAYQNIEGCTGGPGGVPLDCPRRWLPQSGYSLFEPPGSGEGPGAPGGGSAAPPDGFIEVPSSDRLRLDRFALFLDWFTQPAVSYDESIFYTGRRGIMSIPGSGVGFGEWRP
jgi:hypothetical protein